MISSPGVGSGLDVNSIVEQLMVLERRPLDRLEEKKATYEAQISAYGTLTSALSTFKDAMDALNDLADFKKFSAESSDDTVFTATANELAASGSYDLTIDRIAEQHKMAAGNVFADSDTTTIGTAGDTMTIQVGADSFTVDIGGKTLDQIRDAINNATDNTGVGATVINDSTGYRLILSADETGSDNFLQVSYSGTDPFALYDLNQDRDSSGGFTAADLDAVFTFENSFQITRSSNLVDDVISGVTLELKAAGNARLNIERDKEGVKETVQGFIDAYNELQDTLDSLGNGDLYGDSTLRTIESQIRSMLNTEATGLAGNSFTFLSEVGITTGEDGKLSLDGTTFDDALDYDYDSVAQLFANNDQGYAYRLEGLARDLLATDGLVDSRESGLNSRVDYLDLQIQSQENRLAIVEQRYRDQFTALDVMLGQMSSTSAYLAQQLATLPGVA
ncbi:MAG TPA: flagellar cap protein [Thiotrichales bacterium]|nr:flagellar cap protein [Thiotrichales bacterium]